jgi:hypothetical protein
MPLPPPVTHTTRFARDVINTSMDSVSRPEHRKSWLRRSLATAAHLHTIRVWDHDQNVISPTF